MKILTHKLTEEIAIALEDFFETTNLHHKNSSIEMRFSNGQVFILSLCEKQD